MGYVSRICPCYHTVHSVTGCGHGGMAGPWWHGPGHGDTPRPWWHGPEPWWHARHGGTAQAMVARPAMVAWARAMVVRPACGGTGPGNGGTPCHWWHGLEPWWHVIYTQARFGQHAHVLMHVLVSDAHTEARL